MFYLLLLFKDLHRARFMWRYFAKTKVSSYIYGLRKGSWKSLFLRDSSKKTNNWAETSGNVPSDMCTERRLSLSIRAVWSVFVVRVKKLCILDGLKCAGWSESSLGAPGRRYVSCRCGSVVLISWRKDRYCVQMKARGSVLYHRKLFMWIALSISWIRLKYCRHKELPEADLGLFKRRFKISE